MQMKRKSFAEMMRAGRRQMANKKSKPAWGAQGVVHGRSSVSAIPELVAKAKSTRGRMVVMKKDAQVAHVMSSVAFRQPDRPSISS